MERFTRDGLTFDVSDRGSGDSGSCVLLHGWPQDRSAWDRVSPLLNDAGLRTLAPDQRGYSPAARPPGRTAYRMSELVEDVVALLDQAGIVRVHLVGHDWGGAIAWAFAARHPERLQTLTVVSTPHPRALAWALRHGDQARRSWYMLAFQLPVLPEAVLARVLTRVLRDSGLPGEDAERYAARFREPGAATAGLNWYRGMTASASVRRSLRKALGRRQAGGTENPHRITVPTTLVWGRSDPALGRDAAERTRRWVVSDYRFVELDAGHWLPETRPGEVAAEVLARTSDPH
jgi:pimeloyl-ACP methyl ester carboxylesterase